MSDEWFDPRTTDDDIRVMRDRSWGRWTPTTEQVREQYTREEPPHTGTVGEKTDEFYRWLAEHDRQIAAAAWDEGYEDRRADEHEHRPGRKIANPYKEKPHDRRAAVQGHIDTLIQESGWTP